MGDRAQRRDGFALITVLAVMALASGLALSASGIGRDAFHAERNRIALEKSWWRAAGCAARVRAAMDEALAVAVAEPGGQMRVWRTLDRVVAQSALVPASLCAVSVEAAGTRLDVNAATSDELDRLFVAVGLTEHAVSLREALLERIANGASPLPDIRALSRISGFESATELQGVLSTESGRVSLLTASASVLSALPGFTPAVVQRILDMRDQGLPLYDLLQIAGTVPVTDASEMLAHYTELGHLATIDPDAWVITARGVAASAEADSANVMTIAERIVRNGTRVSVMQTRVSP